jgi:hypothetical protein
MSHLRTPFKYHIGSPANAERQDDKRYTEIEISKDRKLCLFLDDMIIDVKNSRESKKKSP